MKLGSLCSGILGLDLAVERHYGAELAWCAEINPAASRVIAARTTATNYGDFRDVTPPAVDVLCAGFPCQPVSGAGKRAGIDDERWLFDDICELLGRMDPPPRMLVFENVRGLLSANGGDAMARVVEGLARCGYVGSWRTVRASDVGAPHRRERIFIVAHLADADGGRWDGWRAGEPATARGGHETGLGRVARASEAFRQAEGGIGRRPQLDALGTRDGAAELGEPDSKTAPDADGERAGWDSRAVPRPVEQTRRAGGDVCSVVDARPDTAPDTDDVGRERRRVTRDRSTGSTHHDFGPYAPAVERWEHIIGRRAPAPVDDQGRLSARFVQFMMGYPDGWVTDVLDRRTDALRCLGNAVVPQQAMHAFALLSPVMPRPLKGKA